MQQISRSSHSFLSRIHETQRVRIVLTNQDIAPQGPLPRKIIFSILVGTPAQIEILLALDGGMRHSAIHPENQFEIFCSARVMADAKSTKDLDCFKIVFDLPCSSEWSRSEDDPTHSGV